MNMEKHPYRVRGFKAAGGACGLKKNGAHDLALIFSEREAAAAGVFTTNRVQAAPVALSREGVRRGRARAILANSGNANACTGPAGMRDARARPWTWGRLKRGSPAWPKACRPTDSVRPPPPS